MRPDYSFDIPAMKKLRILENESLRLKKYDRIYEAIKYKENNPDDTWKDVAILFQIRPDSLCYHKRKLGL